MATPMLRALRLHYGAEARIVGVMRPYVREVLDGIDWLDETILFDPRASDLQLRSRSVIRQLKSARLELSILATNSFRTAMIAFAARIPGRVGYVRYGRGPLLTKRLAPPRAGRRLVPVSAVEYYLELAKTVGANHSDKTMELATTPSGDAHANEIWKRNNLDGNFPVVGLSTGAAYGAAKEWPVEYFAALARQLASEESARAIVLCGPAERNAARRIVELANHPNVSSLADEQVSIELSKCVIRRCQLLISNDSGPRHIGAAFKVPTVTLFGPTDPRWSHNYHSRSIDLQLHVPCGPCAQRTCPLGHHQCMRDLTVEQVFTAASRLLRHTTQIGGTRPKEIGATDGRAA